MPPDAPLADPYDLERFVRAQEPMFHRALSEIESGEKQSHWMWYIFPQIQGLGSSRISEQFTIKSIGEAKAYLHHPLLGPRLLRCAEALLAVEGRSALEILGHPDNLKLRSSATLFTAASESPSVFDRILAKFFPEGPDPKTLELLAAKSSPRG